MTAANEEEFDRLVGALARRVVSAVRREIEHDAGRREAAVRSQAWMLLAQLDSAFEEVAAARRHADELKARLD